MPRAQAGVLIECDPTVKQLILKLDEQAGHTILLEDLDAYRILVTKNQVDHVRRELDRLLEENTYTSGMIEEIFYLNN